MAETVRKSSEGGNGNRSFDGNKVSPAEAALRKSAENGLRPVPLKFEKISVEINLMNDVFVDLARYQYYQFLDHVQANGGTLGFEMDEWTRYLQTIVIERVKNVCHTPKRLFGIRESIRIPALLDVLIKRIGKVKDDTIGLEIWPSIDPVKYKTLTREEMFEVSGKLGLLERFYGFAFSDAFPRELKGDWHFMTMSVIQDHVLATSIEKAHGVNALLASVVLYETVVAEMLSLRCSYGPVGAMKSMLKAFTEPQR